MMERGVNGASASSLNDRFIKCPECKVNIPKEDMLSNGKCTICGRVYEVEYHTQTFDATSTNTQQNHPKKKARKRWIVMRSKRDREFYHNTETGEDRWDKPADFDADASEDHFVPLKNDIVKQAILREQVKMEAKKLGFPLDLLETQVCQEEDPLKIPIKAHNAQTKLSHQPSVPPAPCNLSTFKVDDKEDNKIKENISNHSSCILS